MSATICFAVSDRPGKVRRLTSVNKGQELLLNSGSTLNNAGLKETLDIKLQGASQETFFRIVEGKDGLRLYLGVNDCHVRISHALAREILRRSIS